MTTECVWGLGSAGDDSMFGITWPGFALSATDELDRILIQRESATVIAARRTDGWSLSTQGKADILNVSVRTAQR